MNLRQQIRAALQAFRAAGAITEGTGVDVGILPPDTVPIETLFTTSSTVYRCIRLRSDAIARPPFRVYRPGGSRLVEVPQHPLRTLLDHPNPFWSRQQLKRQIETDLLWHGNAFLGVEYGASGRPAELWRLRPDWMQVVPHRTQYIKGYLYTVNNREIAYEPNEVIHFRYANPLNEYWGLSPLTVARYAAEMGVDAVLFNRKFFENGATVGMYLETDDFMTKLQADELQARWDQAHRGAKRAHQTAVLHSGLKAKQGGINQKDAQWLEGMRWVTEDIARVYGVPGPLVGEDKAVYRNIKDAEAALWHLTLLPELLWFAEILNDRLVPQFEDPNLVIAPDLSEIEALQEDTNAQSLRLQRMVDRGIVTINEAREDLGKAPLPWGNVWHAPLNLAPVSALRSGQQTRSYQLPDGAEGNPQLADDIDDVVQKLFDAESPRVAASYSTGRGNRYDWSRWRVLEGPMIAPIQSQVEEAALSAVVSLGIEPAFDIKNIRAEAWARERAAELITQMTKATQQEVRRIVANSMAEGVARDIIRDRIQAAQSMSRARATMIARTETQSSFNQGTQRGWKESRVVDGREWLLVGSAPCEICTGNATQGVIGLTSAFASGHDTPPGHPNCFCRMLPHLEE